MAGRERLRDACSAPEASSTSVRGRAGPPGRARRAPQRAPRSAVDQVLPVDVQAVEQSQQSSPVPARARPGSRSPGTAAAARRAERDRRASGITERTDSPRTVSTSPGRRSVTSSRLHVKSTPRRGAHGAARGRRRASARPQRCPAARWPSAHRARCPRASARAAGGPSIPTTCRAGVPPAARARRPPQISRQQQRLRTSPGATSAARAIASTSTPASAPCRRLPVSGPRRKRCSSDVARRTARPRGTCAQRSSRPDERTELRQRRVDLGQRERRTEREQRQVAEAAVAEAGAALARLAGEEASPIGALRRSSATGSRRAIALGKPRQRLGHLSEQATRSASSIAR